MVLTEESQDDMKVNKWRGFHVWPFYPENIMRQKLPGLRLLIVFEVSLGEEPKIICTVGRIKEREIYSYRENPA